MEMCYDGALVMPSSYAVMDEEEMTYVEGGAELASVTVLLGPIGVVGATAAFSYIRSHSNPINLGNDNEVRVAVYNALWNL